MLGPTRTVVLIYVMFAIIFSISGIYALQWLIYTYIDMYSDPYPSIDIHPNIGYSNDRGSGVRVHEMGTVPVQYSIGIGFGVPIRVDIGVVLGNINKPQVSRVAT